MKNFLKLFALFACSALVFVACETDETVDDNTVEVTQISTYEVLPGSEKIQVTWAVPDDKDITGAKIVWSGSSDGEHSIGEDDGFVINSNQEYIIPDLNDGGTYSVTIYSLVGGYLGTGSATVSGIKVYGPTTYAEATKPEVSGAVQVTIVEEGNDYATVYWDESTIDFEQGIYGVDVEYKLENGYWNSVVTEFTAAAGQSSVLPLPLAGEYFTYKALYRPNADSSEFDKNPSSEGYDSAEVPVEGSVLIENADLTAATPVIESALGGSGSITVEWSGITDKVVSAIFTFYKYDTDSADYVLDTKVGTNGVVTIANLSTEEVTDEGTQDTRTVATYKHDSDLTVGANYIVDVQNVITGDYATTPVSTVNIFVWDSSSYGNQPKIATPTVESVSMVHDVYSNIITITWDMTDVVISDIDKILVSYYDKSGQFHNDYDGSTVTTDDDVAEVQVISVDGVHTSLLTNYGLGFSSASKLAYKTYFRPSGSIEGEYYIGDEVTKYDDSGSSAYITIPYPALQAPDEVTLKSGYDATTNQKPFLRVSWSKLGLVAYETGISFNINYATESQAGLNSFETKTIAVDYNQAFEEVTLTSGEVGTDGYTEDVYSYYDLDVSTITDIASDETYVVYIETVSTNSAVSDPTEKLSVTTYSPETYAEAATILGGGARAEVLYPVGDDADATIRWDWFSSSTDANAVEVIEYTQRTGSTASIDKVDRQDAQITTLEKPRGATDVKYKVYFRPDSGVNDVEVETKLTLPGIEITEPTLWLTTDLEQNITINWSIESLSNLTGMNIYWKEQSAGTYEKISITGSDFKSGDSSKTLTVSDDEIAADKTYEVYITVEDLDGNTDRAVEVATSEEPMTIKTYNADSYKSLSTSDTPALTAATTADAQIFMFDWSMNEDVRGVIITYTINDNGDTETAGQEDYAGELPDVISIPQSAIYSGSTYSYTLYYYPTGASETVAGDAVEGLDYPDPAPPVPQMVAITSSFDESDKPTIKVEFSIEDYNRAYIVDGVADIYCYESGDSETSLASVELVTGQTAYEVTLTDGQIAAGKTYNIYVGITAAEGYYTDQALQASVEVEGVKAYNTASYYQYIPSVYAEVDYTGYATLEWTIDNASDALIGVTLSYGDYTSSEVAKANLNTSLKTLNYDSAIDSFTYVSSFELEQETEEPLLTYEILEFTIESQPIIIQAKSYDIVNLDGVYRIYTAKGLAAFADVVNGTTTHKADAIVAGNYTGDFPWSDSAAEGVVIANIDLSELDGESTKYEWVSIGTSGSNYTGTFDGGGYIIDNLYASAAATGFGLFGYIGSGVEIDNVRLYNVAISSTASQIAALVGSITDATISNCEIMSGSVSTTGGIAAAIAGTGSGTITITNTINRASVSGTADMGGFITASAKLIISDCSNYGNITTSGSATGGFTGYCTPTDGTIYTNCANYGEISTGGNSAAGIISSHGSSNSLTIINCLNEGDVHCTSSATDRYAGGIIGGTKSGTSIYNCINKGYIYSTGTCPVGGIAGSVVDGVILDGLYDTATSNAYNSGTISGTGTSVGGIVGSNAGSVDDYDNYGTVLVGTATSHTSDNGIYGASTGTVTNCNDYAFDATERDIVLVSDTYQIYTAKGLKAFADLVDGNANSSEASAYNASTKSSIVFSQVAIPAAKAKLMASVDLVDLGYTTNNWTPVATPFEGTFDGGGYTIENLHISNTNSDVALFAILSGGTIQSVTLDNPSITTTGDNVGAVVGTMSADATGSVVDQCYVTGYDAAISGGSNVGGVVGAQMAGSVSNVTNAATVKGSGDNVGGIVGYVAEGAALTSASNTGSVTAEGVNAGGIVGYNEGTVTGDISPISTNSGEVVGSDNVGGIVGNNEGSLSYYENTAEVSLTGEDAENYDGVVGTGSGQVSNCSSTFIPLPDDIDIALMNSVYQIYSAAGLKIFAQIVNAELTSISGVSTVGITVGDSNSDADAKLMNDIDLSALGATTSWDPIGKAISSATATYSSTVSTYTGNFDGNSKTIKNLYINITNTSDGYNQALFGYVSGSIIKNLTLDGVDITTNSGNRHTAALVAHAIGGTTISNCSVTGASSQVTGKVQPVGGVVGYIATGTIENVTNYAAVNGSNNGCGGIVGQTKGVVITGSTNYGEVTTTGGYSGGLIGQVDGSYANIEDCHNKAAVTGGATGYMGGIVGYFNPGAVNGNSTTDATSSYIKDCTNTHKIYATKAEIGGIVGRYNTSASCYIDGCNNSGEVVGTTQVGGIVGKIHAEKADTGKTIYMCNNTGDITGTTGSIGGIVGQIHADAVVSGESTDSRSTNYGSVSGTSGDIGGIVGYNAGTLTYYNNYGKVSIDGEAHDTATGVYGTDEGTVTDCNDYYFDSEGLDLVYIDNAYQIYTAQGLKAFADLVNGSSNDTAATYVFGTGGTITFGTAVTDAAGRVVANIDLSELDEDWNPIGVSSYYTGTFDGGSESGYTISNLYTSSAASKFGLFGYIGYNSSATTQQFTIIKNVKLVDVDITVAASTSASYVAAIAGHSQGNYNSGNNKTYDTYYANSGVITNCYVSGKIDGATNSASNVAAIVGYTDSAVFIDKTVNYATVTAASYAGGFIAGGGTDATKATPFWVENCQNYGSITTTGDYAGGFSGNWNTRSPARIIDCTNYGTITAGGSYAGGIAGKQTTSGTYIRCNNEGIIKATTDYAGGIFGSNAAVTAYACSNTGTVSGTDYVGGISGAFAGTTLNGSDADSGYDTSITSSYNKGVVTGTGDNVGGIIGNFASGTLSNYINKGVVLVGDATTHSSDNGICGAADDEDATIDESCLDECIGTPTALASFGATAGAEEISLIVEWTFDADITNVDGVIIYYGTTESGFYNSMSITGDVAASGTGTYTLTETNDGILADTEYSLYVVTANEDGVPSGTATAITVTTMKELDSADDVVDPDIVVRGTTYEIHTPAGLQAFAAIVNGTVTTEMKVALSTNFAEEADLWSNAAASGKLVENINMEGETWTPIGLAASSGTAAYTAGVITTTFTGTFDGDVYTISNLTINKTETTATNATGTDNYNQALFGYISAATIKNVTLENVNISVCAYFRHTGAVVGHAVSGSTIDNCKVTSGSITGSTQPTGGIAGYVATGTVTNCTNNASVTGANGTAGIVGQVKGIVMSGCANYGAITPAGYSGGVIGQVSNSTDSYANIDDCHNYGDVTSSSINVGGIVGYYNPATINSSSTVDYTSNYVTNCTNSGSIYATGNSVAGIIGSYNPGADGLTYLKGCTNSGDVETTASYVGGIIGDGSAIYEYDDDTYTVYNSSNSGNITGKSYVGGIVGRVNKVAKISGVSTSSRSTNSGNVTATSTYAGGIIGYLTDGSTLTYYNNNGIVMLAGVQYNTISMGGIIGNYSEFTEPSTYITYCTDSKTNQTVAPALTSVSVSEATDVVSITVSWSYASETSGTSGVRIYYGTDGVYESVDISGSSTKTRTLTEADGLAEGTKYSIYVVTYNSVDIETTADIDGGSLSNLLTATTITYDIVYSDDDDTYEIFSETGLFAFADLVGEAENTKSAKIGGFTWPTPKVVEVDVVDEVGIAATKATATNGVSINGRVMKSIELTETWVAIADFAGDFDGGNGLSEVDEVGTSITISGLEGVQGLFVNTEGATLHNITLDDVAIESTSTAVGAVVGSAVDTDITYCSITSGSITAASNVGGIAGQIDVDSTVDNVVNTASIYATEAEAVAGGIVGTNEGTISNATNESMVSINGSEHTNGNGIAGAGEGTVDEETCVDDFSADIEYKEGVYNIYSANGLIAFADLVNGNGNTSNARTSGINTTNSNDFGTAYPTITGVVVDVITLTDDWSPIESFAGTFDGGNGGSGDATDIVISGLKGTQGLFESITGTATVKNVTLSAPAISNADDSATVGAIAGTAAADAIITYCEVDGGSVAVTGEGAVAGALVGENASTAITYSTTSCTVTVAGALQNGGLDSMLVGSGTEAGTGCSDNHTDGDEVPAAAVSGVTAYPTYDGETAKIVVSWTYGASVAKIEKVVVYYSYADGNSDPVEINESITADETGTTTLTVTADTEYDIYVVTENSYEDVTESDATETAPLVVTSYNSKSYDDSMPTVLSAMKSGSSVVVTWNEETISDDLVSVNITYNSEEPFTAEINSETYTSTFDYVTSVNDFTYTATFKPVGYDENEDVLSVTAPSDNSSVSATIAVADIILNGSIYEIYSANGLMAFAALVNGEAQPADATTAVADQETFASFSTPNTGISGTVMNTIDLTDETWTPMKSYAGTFDGGNGGAEATGVEIRNLEGENGLFESITGTATVKNVTLAAPEISIESATASVGAIAGTTASGTTITYCYVNGGSVAVTAENEQADKDAVAGALVGTNAGTINNSSSSCSVTIYELPYNNDTDSWLVGAGVAADSETCEDNYTDGDAATLTTALEITAVPNYEQSTESIKVSWGDALSTLDENTVSATVFCKESGNADSTYAVAEEITNLNTLSSSPTAINFVAGTTYTFYVETYNYVGVGTKSNEATAKAYNAGTYENETLPTLTASYSGSVITVEWDTENLSSELHSMSVTYGDNAAETVTDLTAGTYTMTATYDSATTLTQTGYYAPDAASSDKIAVTATVTITAAQAVLELVGDIYEISSAKGLIAFADLVNGSENSSGAVYSGFTWDDVKGTTGLNAKVTESFTFSGTYTGITGYTGEFDGNSKTITDFTTSSAGLFATTSSGAVIKDLTLLNPYITVSAENKGVFVGVATSTEIYNCHVSVDTGYQGTEANQVFSNSNNNTGAIVGYTSGATGDETTVISCSNAAAITAGTRSGGITGRLNDNTTVKYCLNTGALDIGRYGGGIGAVESATSYIISCTNRGNITAGGNETGGITGSTTNGQVIYCANEGNVDGGTSRSILGGIAGQIYGSGVLDGAKPADYSTEDYNYALLGDLGGNYNSGTVTGTTTIGGIIGNVPAAGIVKYYNNEGESVTGTSIVGGIAGAIVNAGQVIGDTTTNNYNNATVIATDDTTVVGGLVGNANTSGTITNYTNNGAVYSNTDTLLNEGDTSALVGSGTAGDDCVDMYGVEDTGDAGSGGAGLGGLTDDDEITNAVPADGGNAGLGGLTDDTNITNAN